MAWTEITSTTSWQDLAIAQELAGLYNRIASCLGYDTVAEPTAETRVFDFVSAMQAAVTAAPVRTYAIDPAAELVGLIDGGDYPDPYADLDALYAAAGIASGFRRIPEGGPFPSDWTDYDDPAYSYGAIQDKDAAGPWLARDLQLMLTALGRHKIGVSVVDSEKLVMSEPNSDDPLPDYPTEDFAWEPQEAAPIESTRMGLYFSSALFFWSCAIHRGRFATVFFKSGSYGLGSGSRDVDFIGRRVNNIAADYFDPIFGAEHGTTAVLYSVHASTDEQTETPLIGADIEGWTEVFPTRPEYPENIGTWSMAFIDMIAVLKFDP